jgi:hypothetical protein
MIEGPDSGTIPLDGGPEFTPQERLLVRKLIRDTEHMSWLKKRLRWFIPGVAAFAASLWAVINWVQTNIHWKG